MSRLLTILLLAPLALIAIVFCVVNREPVTLSMDALGTSPQFAATAPLFVWLLGFLILGLLLGGLGTWIGQTRYRARAEHRGEEAARLRREIEERDARLRRIQENEDRQRRETTAMSGPALGGPRTVGQSALAGPRGA